MNVQSCFIFVFNILYIIDIYMDASKRAIESFILKLSKNFPCIDL